MDKDQPPTFRFRGRNLRDKGNKNPRITITKKGLLNLEREDLITELILSGLVYSKDETKNIIADRLISHYALEGTGNIHSEGVLDLLKGVPVIYIPSRKTKLTTDRFMRLETTQLREFSKNQGIEISEEKDKKDYVLALIKGLVNNGLDVKKVSFETRELLERETCAPVSGEPINIISGGETRGIFLSRDTFSELSRDDVVAELNHQGIPVPQNPSKISVVDSLIEAIISDSLKDKPLTSTTEALKNQGNKDDKVTVSPKEEGGAIIVIPDTLAIETERDGAVTMVELDKGDTEQSVMDKLRTTPPIMPKSQEQTSLVAPIDTQTIPTLPVSQENSELAEESLQISQDSSPLTGPENSSLVQSSQNVKDVLEASSLPPTSGVSTTPTVPEFLANNNLAPGGQLSGEERLPVSEKETLENIVNKIQEAPQLQQKEALINSTRSMPVTFGPEGQLYMSPPIPGVSQQVTGITSVYDVLKQSGTVDGNTLVRATPVIIGDVSDDGPGLLSKLKDKIFPKLEDRIEQLITSLKKKKEPKLLLAEVINIISNNIVDIRGDSLTRTGKPSRPFAYPSLRNNNDFITLNKIYTALNIPRINTSLFGPEDNFYLYLLGPVIEYSSNKGDRDSIENSLKRLRTPEPTNHQEYENEVKKYFEIVNDVYDEVFSKLLVSDSYANRLFKIFNSDGGYIYVDSQIFDREDVTSVIKDKSEKRKDFLQGVLDFPTMKKQIKRYREIISSYDIFVGSTIEAFDNYEVLMTSLSTAQIQVVKRHFVYVLMHVTLNRLYNSSLFISQNFGRAVQMRSVVINDIKNAVGNYENIYNFMYDYFMNPPNGFLFFGKEAPEFDPPVLPSVYTRGSPPWKDAKPKKSIVPGFGRFGSANFGHSGNKGFKFKNYMDTPTRIRLRNIISKNQYMLLMTYSPGVEDFLRNLKTEVQNLENINPRFKDIVKIYKDQTKEITDVPDYGIDRLIEIGAIEDLPDLPQNSKVTTSQNLPDIDGDGKFGTTDLISMSKDNLADMEFLNNFVYDRAFDDVLTTQAMFDIEYRLLLVLFAWQKVLLSRNTNTDSKIIREVYNEMKDGYITMFKTIGKNQLRNIKIKIESAEGEEKVSAERNSGALEIVYGDIERLIFAHMLSIDVTEEDLSNLLLSNTISVMNKLKAVEIGNIIPKILKDKLLNFVETLESLINFMIDELKRLKTGGVKTKFLEIRYITSLVFIINHYKEKISSSSTERRKYDNEIERIQQFYNKCNNCFTEVSSEFDKILAGVMYNLASAEFERLQQFLKDNEVQISSNEGLRIRVEKIIEELDTYLKKDSKFTELFYVYKSSRSRTRAFVGRTVEVKSIEINEKERQFRELSDKLEERRLEIKGFGIDEDRSLTTELDGLILRAASVVEKLRSARTPSQSKEATDSAFEVEKEGAKLLLLSDEMLKIRESTDETLKSNIKDIVKKVKDLIKKVKEGSDVAKGNGFTVEDGQDELLLFESDITDIESGLEGESSIQELNIVMEKLEKMNDSLEQLNIRYNNLTPQVHEVLQTIEGMKDQVTSYIQDVARENGNITTTEDFNKSSAEFVSKAMNYVQNIKLSPILEDTIGQVSVELQEFEKDFDIVKNKI